MPSMSEASFPEITVSGGPFERGRQHGSQAGDLIRAYLDRFIEELRQGERAARLARAGRPVTRELILERTREFLPGYEEFAPHLVEEIRGIAAGARVTFAEALLCNVHGEVAGLIDDACTAFAIGRRTTADGQMLAGQNSDQAAWNRDAMIVLRVKPSQGPAALMCTHAGLIGYHGFNAAGVGQFAIAVPSPGWRRGMPQYLMKRVLLEQESLEGCLDVFGRARIASAGNYVLADRTGRMLDVELTSAGPKVVGRRDDFVVHANHYEHPDLTHLNASMPRLAGSTCRSARLESLIRENRGRITVGHMQDALRDHRSEPATICRHDWERSETVASMIAELDQGRFHVSRGNPCQNKYATYLMP